MCNLHLQFRVSHNSGWTSLSINKQTAVKHVQEDWQTVISGSHLTHVSSSSASFPGYSLPLRIIPLFHQFLSWGQKVNQPGLEITLSVWEVVCNTAQVSSPVPCGSWQIVSVAQLREQGWRELKGQMQNEVPLELGCLQKCACHPGAIVC